MAIKGGLLDCEGQLENEENFNRIRERHGYAETLLDWGSGDGSISMQSLTKYPRPTLRGIPSGLIGAFL